MGVALLNRACTDALAVSPVVAIARDPLDSRVLQLLLADRTLTAEEWAEIEAAESAAGPVQHFPALLTAVDLLHPLAAAKLVDRIIHRLDLDQGDIDFEDDDPAGADANDVGEVEEWRPEGIELARPLYAIDQSKGPLNEREAHHDYMEAIHARGAAEWEALRRVGGAR